MSIRRENYHSIYILLFLNIAFFFMQLQDAQRFRTAFAFDPFLVLHGQFWRIVTYQFLTPSFLGSGAIGIFVALLMLYILGAPIEEEFGTAHFVGLFLVSTLVTAGIAFIFGVPVLGAYFANLTLLFIYADLNPEQTFYLMFFIPMKVKWIAWVALAFLAWGVVTLNPVTLAVAGGCLAAWGYFRVGLKGRSAPRIRTKRPPLQQPPPQDAPQAQRKGQENLERFREIKRIAESGTSEERETMVGSLEPGVIPGVNICPPADYKPEGSDLYCVRCEGFNECSIRFLRASEGSSDVQDDDRRSAGG